MEPVRTCLGCRQRTSRSSLMRIVAQRGQAVVDTAAVLPGRGAWVHPTTACVEAAVKRRAFGRALRARDLLDPAPVLAHVIISEREQAETAHGSLMSGSK